MGFRLAVAGSLALHLAALGLFVPAFTHKAQGPVLKTNITILATVVAPVQTAPPAKSTAAKPHASPPKKPAPTRAKRQPSPLPTTAPGSGQAFMDAPAAPSAQEWTQASTYTLKNSKRYRYNWGQHLRSLMGTAHEGPEQGAVRFRIEIAPSGTLARLDTLWSTSEKVEQRARAAVRAMPPLPPTPTGQPLVFEKTIVFDAFTTDTPALYKHDCEPDPPQHGNRFVWDGRSPQLIAAMAVTQRLEPLAYAECLNQLPQDSIEAEAASNERQLKQWASPTLRP